MFTRLTRNYLGLPYNFSVSVNRMETIPSAPLPHAPSSSVLPSDSRSRAVRAPSISSARDLATVRPRPEPFRRLEESFL